MPSDMNLNSMESLLYLEDLTFANNFFERMSVEEFYSRDISSASQTKISHPLQDQIPREMVSFKLLPTITQLQLQDLMLLPVIDSRIPLDGKRCSRQKDSLKESHELLSHTSVGT